MIPTTQPGSTLVRISEPRPIGTFKRTRVRANGELYHAYEKQYGVDVRCTYPDCGNEYPMRLSTWLHRCPRECIKCMGKNMAARRSAAAAVRRESRYAAFMLGWSHGAVGRLQIAGAIPAYYAGHAWGCKQRVKSTRLAAHKYRRKQAVQEQRRSA